MAYEKICRTCGKQFFAIRVQSNYCCDECRKIGNRKNVNAAAKRFRERKRKNKKLSIGEINSAARKENMTYGKYVAKYGI